MSAIDSIQLSGLSYDLKDKSATTIVNVTQAEYDALVTGGTVDLTVLYNITDAQPTDISQYWTSAQTQSAINQATSGKVNTSSIVSAVTSGSTDAEIPTAKAVYDATQSGGGGGKAITAGTNISVTTGETADTVSCTLPISADSNNIYTTTSYPFRSTAPRKFNAIFGENNYIEVFGSNNNSNYNTILGNGNAIQPSYKSASYNFICGYHNFVKNNLSYGNAFYCSIFGANNTTWNGYETAFGQYNNSVYSSTTFGYSGNTLFSVGNGTADNARHNAFEIRQNGDIYCNNGTSDVKLQDYIQFKTVQITQSAYDALVQGGTVDANTIYYIVN